MNVNHMFKKEIYLPPPFIYFLKYILFKLGLTLNRYNFSHHIMARELHSLGLGNELGRRKYDTSSAVAARLIPEICSKNMVGGYISAAFADSTWKKFSCAEKSFVLYENFKGVKSSWPLNQSVLTDYAGWAFTHGGLKASTLQAYLGGLKCIHELKGLDSRGFGSFVLKSVIRGKENLEVYDNVTSGTRKVMTLPLLKILGHEIAKSGWIKNSKQVVWGAATLAFFGSFRAGEILVKGEKVFCPDDTLLWKDVKFCGEDHILIHIKNPKSRQKEGEFVDIFSFEGNNVCPVKALRNLKDSLPEYNPNDPVFKFEGGKNLTTRGFNEILKNLMTIHLGDEARHISGHSFRAAIPAVLAKFPKLCNSLDIMGWGRWRSDAYLVYTRLKVDQKRCTFHLITDLLNK